MEPTSAIETKYQELLFLCTERPDSKGQFILLLHAINLVHELKCTGLLEDDPEAEYVVPPNWNKDAEGVFSFRYFDPKAKDTIYFKFVTEDTLMDVNAVSASKNDKINSIEFKLSDYPTLDTASINEIYKKYRNEFLVNVLAHLKSAEEPKKTEPRNQPFIIEDVPDRDLFWRMPRNDHQPNVPFGDYGRSDLFPGGVNPVGGINTGGNLLGPNNPIFQTGPNVGGNTGFRPHIRYDPTGPGNIDPTNPDPDLFIPQGPGNPFQKKGPGGPGGPFGGPGGGFGGGFGGGGFGGGFI